MSISLKNCPIPVQFKINAYERHLFNWNEDRTADIYDVFFTSMAMFLQFHESKDAGKVALVLNDDKNNFKMAAIVTYHKPSDEDEEKGNFSIEFALNKEDLKDISAQNVYDTMNSEFQQMATKILYDNYHGEWQDNSTMQKTFCLIIETLISYMTANAVEGGEPLEIELDGIFLASSAIEDGQVVIAITPGDTIKRLIKNDAMA